MTVVTQCMQCGQKISEEISDEWEARYLCDDCMKKPVTLNNTALATRNQFTNYQYQLYGRAELAALENLKTFIVEK